jgi:hypothetical protein
MPDDERSFEFKGLSNGFPDLQPFIEDRDETAKEVRPTGSNKGSYFSKELVLRLIDWLEQNNTDR